MALPVVLCKCQATHIKKMTQIKLAINDDNVDENVKKSQRDRVSKKVQIVWGYIDYSGNRKAMHLWALKGSGRKKVACFRTTHASTKAFL